MGVKTLMLDTSAYALFKRGYEAALLAVQTAPKILIPAIVLGELMGGFAAGSRQPQNEAELEAFRENPRVAVVPVTSETAVRYATIYAYLRGIGRPIPTHDLWIAATAMEHSATLLTADAHFQVVPQILHQFLTA